MKYFNYIALLLLLTLFCNCQKKESLDLSGDWQYQLDREDKGIEEMWFEKNFEQSLALPGSLADNGIGDKVDITTQWTADNWGKLENTPFFTDVRYAKYRTTENFKFPYWLQPERRYLGAVWYQKSIKIPSKWEGKRISLSLERCHWETEVWLNSKHIGVQKSLATAHQYDLSEHIIKGENTIHIKVDNRIKDINPGINAHSISDHTQSNWNGIIGDININVSPQVHIKELNIYPDIDQKIALTKIFLQNGERKEHKTSISIRVKDLQSNKYLPGIKKEIEFSKHTSVEVPFPMGETPLLWDEFHPNLYRMEVTINTDGDVQKRVIQFGMREIKVQNKNILINDIPRFFRGTLECAIFPKTGYPPTNESEWIHIFNQVKNFGLNHIRFHSWCPPEAAFNAADKLGLYLQVEASVWANIGFGKAVDQWIYDETKAILHMYGNHPSFVMMVHGNEPWGDDRDQYLRDYLNYWKEKDKRRIYAPGSGWPVLEEGDYSIVASPRIQHWGAGLKSIINGQAPQTTFDHDETINKIKGPVISHEIGQWCVYPDFSEIKKYTGNLKAKNFELFEEELSSVGLQYLADSFVLASGKLQTLCYKADIEALLRSKNSSGFQLLDLHDFPGQGTALVGVLNAFWEEKGYVTGKEYSAFCNSTVALARFKKRIFYDNEPVEASIEVTHYGAEAINNAECSWQITNAAGQSIRSGLFNVQNIPVGGCHKLGAINEKMLPNTLGKFTLKVEVNGYANFWDFWVYPHKREKIDSDIYITQSFSKEAEQVLNNGGKVLLSFKKGTLKPEYGGNIGIGFSSIFWNTAWTKGQKPHTLGILCNPKHKALAQFPTEYHSNWQWWDAMSHSNAIMMDSLFTNKTTPIVRVIDDWVTNRDLGLILEAKVGDGKMLISGIDLFSDVESRPEAQQLLHSLELYMVSDAFEPQNDIQVSKLTELCTSQE